MTEAHPRVSHTVVTVDSLVLRTHQDRQEVLLVTRQRPPFVGKLAFPGGHLDFNEDPESAGLRELREECGLEGEIVKLLAVAGKPNRDPRGHYVTIVYLVNVRDTSTLRAGDDAAQALFYPVSEMLQQPEAFAFDHYDLLRSVISLV